MVGTPIKFCGRHEIHEFLPPINWGKIKRRVNRFVHIVSLDDPYVPYRHGIEFQKKIRRATG